MTPEDGLREAAQAVVKAWEADETPEEDGFDPLVYALDVLRLALRSTPAAPREVLVKDEGYWAGYNAAKREFTPAAPQPDTAQTVGLDRSEWHVSDDWCGYCAGTHDDREADFMNGKKVRRLLRALGEGGGR